VRLKLGDGLHVSATSAEAGDNTSIIDARLEGMQEPFAFVIAMNSKYILDMLAQLDVTDVTMEFTQPNRPLKVTTDGRLYVCMPMHPPR
jgi:DNA polymerase III sliding clamp (beta) subunit (PCNA family)